jgi:cell division septum initiation protein DivIVA
LEDENKTLKEQLEELKEQMKALKERKPEPVVEKVIEKVKATPAPKAKVHVPPPAPPKKKEMTARQKMRFMKGL